MRILKASVRAFLRVIQTVAIFAPFALHYYGSHTMGAHRHFKVRGDAYRNGILCDSNLAIAAVVATLALLLLLALLLFAMKHRPRPVRLWSVARHVPAAVLLPVVLILPAAKGLLVFPWIVFCAALIWALQLVKLFLLERESFSALKNTLFAHRSGKNR